MIETTKGFYDLVEDPEYLQDNPYYSDTDSIYIGIPNINNIQDLKEQNKIIDKVSIDINNLIIEYLTKVQFKRCNLDPKQNHTFFKAELSLESILFLPDVKKQYAYKTLVKDGIILEKPKVNYKGIQVVRSDSCKLNQKLIRTLIEDVMLNAEVDKDNKLNFVVKVLNGVREEFDNYCNDFEVEPIGLPVKWAKSKPAINAMQVYNFLIDKKLFLPGSAGRFIYCKFEDIKTFEMLKFDMKNLNAVVFPYMFDKELVKERFKKYGIKIDIETQWGRVYTTTVRKIIKLAGGGED